MTGTQRRFVQYHSDAWTVRSPGAVRVSFRSDDRGAAVARAKRILRNAGGGEVHVLGRGGEIDQIIVVPRPGRASRADLRVN